MVWRSLLPLLRLSLAGYTDRAVNAVSAAWRLADSTGCPAVGPEHLRAGLADPRGRWPQPVAVRGRCRGLSPDAVAVLAAAKHEARRAGVPYVGTEHIAAVLAAGRPAGDAEPGAAADPAS